MTITPYNTPPHSNNPFSFIKVYFLTYPIDVNTDSDNCDCNISEMCVSLASLVNSCSAVPPVQPVLPPGRSAASHPLQQTAAVFFLLFTSYFRQASALITMFLLFRV